MEDVRAKYFVNSLKSTKNGLIKDSSFFRVEFKMRWISGLTLKLLKSTISNEGISEVKYLNSKILNSKDKGYILVEGCNFIEMCGDLRCSTELIKGGYPTNTIDISNSTFRGIKGDGEHNIFATNGGTLNIKNHSYFMSNSGITGGIVRMTSNLYLNISDSFFYDNEAHSAGAVHFLGPGFLEISGSHFEGHNAEHSGGVFRFSDHNIFTIKKTSFIRNSAHDEGSVAKFIDVSYD